MLDSSGMCTSKSLIILHRRKRSRGATAKHNEKHTHTIRRRERESQPAEESVRVMRIWGRHQKNTGQQEAMQPPPPPPPAKCARFSLVHVGIKPALRAGRAPAERARRDRENTCLARCVFSSEKGNVL